MELTTSWMEEGIEKGLILGREEGRVQGRKAALDITRQFLVRQVGALSESVAARVNDLTLDQLRALGTALLDFRTAADLEAWLANEA